MQKLKSLYSRLNIYNEFEKKQKRYFLKNLSEKEGIALLRELYSFAARLPNKPRFDILDMKRIEILTKVHLLFNKVK